jgi:uncharacterized membrane protein YkoI
MIKTLRKNTLTTAVAIGAAGLGGAAIAGAAANGNSKSSNSSKTQQRGGQPPQREQLSAADAAKVKQAALDKVPGDTVLRTEAGGPYSTPYHAHIKTSDGKRQVVLVNASFEATAVQADNGPRGGRGPGGRHGGPGGPGHEPETALTGDTKQKVEDAVLARYPGATTVRTETNSDGDAPYESHITTTDGKELEVLVSKDFEVVGANEHPARP